MRAAVRVAEFTPVRTDRSPRSADDGAEWRVRDHEGVTDKPADPNHDRTDHRPDDQTGHRTDDPSSDLASDPSPGPTRDLTSDRNGQPADRTTEPTDPTASQDSQPTDRTEGRTAEPTDPTAGQNSQPADRTEGRVSDRAKRRRPSLDEIFGDVLPATTSDEREPEAPSGDRDSWYEQNRPPHHDRG